MVLLDPNPPYGVVCAHVYSSKNLLDLGQPHSSSNVLQVSDAVLDACLAQDPTSRVSDTVGKMALQLSFTFDQTQACAAIAHF